MLSARLRRSPLLDRHRGREIHEGRASRLQAIRMHLTNGTMFRIVINGTLFRIGESTT